MNATHDIDWTLVRWDDFTTWPPLPTAGWPIQYQLQAEVALVRNGSGIDIQIEPGADGTYTVVGRGHFRHPLMHSDDALEFLEGFKVACESMMIHYRCVPRSADELD